MLDGMLCWVGGLVGWVRESDFLHPHVDEGGVLHGDNNWEVDLIVPSLT